MTPPWLTQEARRAAVQPQVYVQDELCVAFLQFFGAFVCGRIGLEHIELRDFERVESALLHELDLAFFEDRFLTASSAEQELLVRMAGHSGDRVSAMELRDRAGDLPNVNELLRRLVVRGLLYRPTRGSYKFALPLFGRYLRRHHEITRITGPVISGQRPRRHAARRRR